ncbi:TlpA family protein disulfide reductase [Jonesia denitrificans]|uniref:Redoxin domain protein n=1 Tax=Jonesia denitrificans (strain ATCC 14870 / DSM 20603 / BCRC 15368 / CIP 55.134 / JCM 11481 / NBRC 15587 / NCTC 10816 / Prevot 55134) TaxID=471856 RepID=C7R0M8_JONDD|nr:TlpA disulfide reductase family protein [Jonesia denitrificans]ACV08185.1 Redoxin domain protein [Jonesia denitrificans DSM 20603]SQH20166.1 Thiol-disulfide oxidoreductase resA [Jonesia denitrificans]
MASPALFTPMKRPVIAVLLALATASGVVGCAQESGNSTDVVQQGYQSGDGSITTWDPADRPGPVVLEGVSMTGDQVTTEQWQGQIVVLNTWYAACPPCRAEADDLVAVASARADDGVQFLGINRHDDTGTAAAFEREHGVTWPSLHDVDGAATAALSGVVPVKAVPTTVIVDEQGRVAARVLGEVSEATLNGLIDDVRAASGVDAP